MTEPRLGVRWTIGDVSQEGFEALRLSIAGACRLFGPRARYRVCVNTVGTASALERTGGVPDEVEWQDTTAELPPFLLERMSLCRAEGVGWKFAPLRSFPEMNELALDNDCILWEMPEAIGRWFEETGDRQCLIAEDVVSCLGAFERLCGPKPRNSGIRGMPGGFDLEDALRDVLDRTGARLDSELDEQGLQLAALSRFREPLLVRVSEVTICSPFPPHLPNLGSCGAHFCGLNAKNLPWSLEGRPASDFVREHWRRHRPALYERVGLTWPP